MRKCFVNDKPAYFHMWVPKTRIVPPSIMKGGHNGGVAVGTVAIVEYEDGTVEECLPSEIKFINRPEIIGGCENGISI